MMEERTQNILIISPAVEPSRPMISAVFIVLLGLICGLIGGSVLAFVIDNLDTRIFTSEQVSEITTAPVLGSFPQLHRKKDHNIDISPAMYSGYLMLRKRIFQSLQSRRAKTILITSPNPMEGKSIVAAGLASGLAEERYKVLIIDANLRSPRQQAIHSVADKEDLSAFLRNEKVEVEDVIQRNVKPGVDLLPCLTETNDPAELLQSNQVKVLFEKVKTYDFVLIDTPALLSVPDAYNLTAFVDGVLIVIQRGSTAVSDVQSACKYLEDSATKLLGIVINQMPMKVNLSYSHSEAEWVHRIKLNAEKLISRRS
jgi:capsular exopolysaccharide synthesis family protein